ncbi:hypothetical protein MMPV_001945 [Pyropia vietnamensis]
MVSPTAFVSSAAGSASTQLASSASSWTSSEVATTAARPTLAVATAARRRAYPSMVAAQTKETQEVPSGLKYLPKDAQERALNASGKFEQLKIDKDGSAMWTEIHELAALLKAGETKWEDIDADDIDMRLKWAGLFHRRKRTPGRFMMRLKVPNGILNSTQLRFLSDCISPYGTDGCADITTRMNIQLRGIVTEDAAAICDGLYENGLTSFMSGMDNVRNMVGSPIAGIDPHEIVDTRALCTELNDMITNYRKGNPELTNLPRKFNICVSGSRDDFAHTHINDIGLVPMAAADGEIGFNVVVGGMFSIKRNVEAVPMDVWLTQAQVTPFCKALLEVFRDQGDRKVRQKTRLMYMIDQWGADGLRDRVAKQMGGVELAPAVVPGPEYDTPWPRRDIQGVHAQKQEGLSWVGLNVPAGRITADDLSMMADVADRYSGGEMRVTVEQNVLFPNVANDQVDAFLAEPLVAKFPATPGPLAAGLVSCTGAQFCGIALIETKNRAMELVKVLESQLEIPQLVRVHWTGCPNSCGQVQVADIGLMGCPARKNGKAVEGVKIFLGGSIGEGAELGEEVSKGIPADFEDLVPAMTKILVERFGATVRA